jgi:transcriptional regulator
MYVPEHFSLSADQISALLSSPVAGDLVTTSETGLAATYVPMLFEAGGDLGVLTGHVSRVNPQWRDAGEALFIIHGPQDYVAAEWLSRPEAVSVPTWNYVTVHVHGELVAHPEPEWCLEAVKRLSAGRGDATVTSMDEEAVEKLLRSIVGLELRITKVVGKAKMSQNKSPEVIEQVIAGFDEVGNTEAAQWMRENSLPRAIAKAELVGGLREQTDAKR